MGRIAILLMTLLALSGGAADKAVAEVAVETADRDMLVARYYVGRRDYSGAINRFKIVVTKFKSSEYIEEALASLAEAYGTVGPGFRCAHPGYKVTAPTAPASAP